MNALEDRPNWVARHSKLTILVALVLLFVASGVYDLARVYQICYGNLCVIIPQWLRLVDDWPGLTLVALDIVLIILLASSLIIYVGKRKRSSRFRTIVSSRIRLVSLTVSVVAVVTLVPLIGLTGPCVTYPIRGCIYLQPPDHGYTCDAGMGLTGSSSASYVLFGFGGFSWTGTQRTLQFISSTTEVELGTA